CDDLAAGALGTGLCRPFGAGSARVADGANPFDAVGHRHPVRRRHPLFSWRVDQSATRGHDWLHALKGRIGPVNVRFACPTCAEPGRLDAPLPAEWQCPACDQLLRPHPLPACAVCANRELYRKKDFPHGLGLALLTVACVASAVAYGMYHQWLTWTIL